MKKLFILAALVAAAVQGAGAFTIDSGIRSHVQGMAADSGKGEMYFSFTTRFIKTDMHGTFLGSIDRIDGHLGDMVYDKDRKKIFASLECKDDEIGRGIAGSLGTEVVKDSRFYIAVIDPEKMQIESRIPVEEAIEDYKTGACGCSGIDGMAISPLPGEKRADARRYLFVAYGIYSDVDRTDNDNQILLCYDIDSVLGGSSKIRGRYTAHTGNTSYGVQGLDYDPCTGRMYMFVYRGRKKNFTNRSVYAVDMTRKAVKGALTLCNEGLEDPLNGIGGWDFGWGTTGFQSNGDGTYWVAESYRDHKSGNECCNVRKYRASDDPRHLFVTDDPYAPSEYKYRNFSQADELWNEFLDPDGRYRPFVRWWWNGDKVEAGELVRELHLLKEAGIGGVEINPIEFPLADSLDLGKKSLRWLSDEWIEALGTVFDEAARLGMTCDLIVGSGWPFGAESLPTEERACVMLTLAEEVEGGSVYESSRFNIFKKVDPGVSVENPRRTCELISMKMAPATINSLDDIVDVTDKFDGDVIKLDIPEGRHFIYSLVRFDSFACVINGAPGAAGSILNHLDATAVRKYLDNMAATIEARTGPLSRHLRAFFVDSMELEGMNWSDDFAAEFKARRGYDIMPWLPFTMFKVGRLGNVEKFEYGADKSPEFRNEVDRVRFDFELTKAEMLHERYTATYLQWCKDMGVKSRAQAYGRGFFPLESSLGYDIPEGESWTTNWLRHRIGEEMGDEDYRRGRGYTMINKYVSSAAHLTGKRLVSAEEMTNTYKVFSTSLEFLKLGSDMSAISGTTHSVWHGFNYSPREAKFPGWVQYGSYYNEKNTWWPYFHLLNDYRARLSSQLQNADMVTDIALLPANYDMWTTMGVPTDPFPVQLNVPYTSLVWEAIHKNGGGADYITENIIKDAVIKDGRLCYGAKEYAEVFLIEVGGTTPEVLDKLTDLVKQGGRVFCIGQYPCRSLGYKDYAERDKEIQSKVEALRQYPDNFILLDKPSDGRYLEWYTDVMKRYSLPHSITIETPDRFVLQNHYKADDGADMFLVMNAHLSEDRPLVMDIPESVWKGRSAWIYDPGKGTRYVLPIDDGKVDMVLGPSETYLFVFNGDPQDGAARYMSLQGAGDDAIELRGWDVRLHHSEEDRTWEMHLDTLVDFKDIKEFEHFMGDITYTTTFDYRGDIQYLDLGKVADIAEVKVNGRDAGTLWYGRRICSLKPYLHEGPNTLEIKVTTLMSNYVGSLKDNQVAYRFVIKRNTPLVPAGLIGPVKIY